MDIETVRRLSMARHLFELGKSSLRSTNDVFLFSAVNLLHDAAEAFLIAIADHVGANVDQNTKFDKYFVQINEKIAPKELPFKSKLLRLNRIRVDSKHYGIQPARGECEQLAVSVREFFDEVAMSLLNVSFSTVSAIDLLEDGESKTLLFEAKTALERGAYDECAINCRKAIFLSVEKPYDISEFAEDQPQRLFGPFTYAPFYTQSKEYIVKNVCDPTDFIVFDHSHLNQELLTKGVDNTAFWNVWRLTPEVIKTKTGDWVVKRDFAKLDGDVLRDRIDYIFSATVDIVLAIHTTRRAAMMTSRDTKYYISLKHENVPVYEKADRGSKVTRTTPPGMIRIDTNFSVEGFRGDGPYYHVVHWEEGLSLYGYVHQDFVKLDA